MLISHKLSWVGLLVAVLVLAGCSPQQGGEATTTDPGAQRVTLAVGNSMTFDPTEITVRSGQPVLVALHDSGVTPHDFTLNEGVAQAVTISAAGGQTATGTFTIQQPGTYAFICSMPGHAAAGMRGTITAT